MNAIEELDNPKVKLKLINDEINRLEKQIAKKEDDGIYDSDLYNEIERLEFKRNKLEEML